MKVRLNEKIKENTYYEYANKHNTYNIDDVVDIIKVNPFYKKYGDSCYVEKCNYFDINNNNLEQKFLGILKKEKKYLKNILQKYNREEKGKEKCENEKDEKGLMYVYKFCHNILENKEDINKSKGYIIINKNNIIKKIYIYELGELLTEIIYITLTKDDIENGLLILLGEKYLDFIINIIKNKEDIRKDMKLLSKQVDIKENTLVANFFITNKLSKKVKNQSALNKKENITKIIDYFLYSLKESCLEEVKKIYIPNEDDKLEEINVPKNTIYTYSDNFTKVKINRLENLQFDKKDLVSVNILPFWCKYIFDFEYFNYIQSKVFKAAFQTNKNLLVCAPTGCGKTNIALLVILQQIILFCEQNNINLNKIVKSYLLKNNINYQENKEEKNEEQERTKKNKENYDNQKNEKNNMSDSFKKDDKCEDDKDSRDDYSTISDKSKKFFEDNISSHSYSDSTSFSNLDNKEIKINSKEFKIIYIAPMKSLVFEITNLFQTKLKIFNLNVCEYTKEYSLSSKELEQVHIIITVPEKLDILLRNSSYSTTVSDESLIKYIKCLILDEVHLLNTDRGDVIETIVARFLRYSETSQSVRRIMSMSATLPNYEDVRDFLKVENDMCFYFSERYRSIQLDKTLYGIHEKNNHKLYTTKNVFTYNEIMNSLKKDKQCIIFVCSRNETNKTIEFLISHALKNNEIDYFTNNLYIDNNIDKSIKKSSNSYIKEFFTYGCSVHHAGMSRSDKILVENLFKKKAINILCCTSTLAWGVNLPVHTVIIKGTNYFSSESGKVEDLDILDINQIFGRCGRPQYENHGNAILITERTKLYKYIKLLTNNTIIESNFLKNIENHLNAEISIGTAKNVEDGIKWLEYTYLYVRMKKNPYIYDADINNDINLYNKRKEIILKAVNNLSENKLVRRVLLTNDFIGTFYGKIAAKYYVDYRTIGIFAENINNNDYVEIIEVISKAKEFENIQIRNEDMKDFLYLKQKCDIKEDYDESKFMTLRILIEIYLRRLQINNFSIMCEINYIIQNIIRILYAYYEICLNILKNISNLIINTHNLILAILRRLPINCGIFRHFCYKNELIDKKRKYISNHEQSNNSQNKDDYLNKIIDKSSQINLLDIKDDYAHSGYKRNQNYTIYLKEAAVNILEKKNLTYESIENLSRSELFFFVRNEVYTNQILYYKNIIPNLLIDGYIQPITQTIMKINLNVQLKNTIWSDQWNDVKEDFHLFLLNTLNDDILYFQKFSIHKKDRKKIHDISFEFPLSNQIPPQITVQFLSMNWCNLSYVHIFNTNNLFINQKINIFSEILSVVPLSTQVLKIPNYIKFFSFKYFNPIQTQMFHATFHTDENILLGAPTGSGKTVIGELCILRNLLNYENEKSVYVCPMKAIVNERFKNWKSKFKLLFNKNVIELTGDKNENKESIASSNIIICTPEKLDVISRNWKHKKYVKNINLIIFDEIHLLGQENRGGVIEILVNRFKNMQNDLKKKIRLIGLTTVITSVDDLILWLDVKENYLFNFPSSCRIVPCKTHVLGFTQKAYCNRMSVMNKNVFDSINQYAQSKNVLIFVSSRRQTRLTAYDIISLNLSSHNLNFLHVENLLNDKNHINFLLNKNNKNEKKSKIHKNDKKKILNYKEGKYNHITVNENILNGNSFDNNVLDIKYKDIDIFDYNTLLDKNLSEQDKTDIGGLLFQNYLNVIEDKHLKELLKYGIGIHHAGLNENDKSIVEYFFLNKIIQILICTSTLAWGINLPAYLVIIKGNEYYDAKTKKYKDISYTDLLQMIGRAGRPQFDDKALAILLVQEKKKNAIKNFLYHPMNIESNILENLNEFINAEICSNVINNKEDMFNYLTKSYYFKRLFSNPSYYIKDIQYVQLYENNKLSSQAKKTIYDHLNQIIDNTINFLVENNCINVIQEDYDSKYYSTPLGHIASMYYIKCETAYFFYKSIERSCNINSEKNSINDATDTENSNTPQCCISENNLPNVMEINDEEKGIKEDEIKFVNKKNDKCNLKKVLDFYDLFELIAQAKEFKDIPLRHNEEKYNVKLRNQIPLDIDMNMPNIKTYLLLLSCLYECSFESVDYNIDLKLVLDQIARVINGFIDICLLFHKYSYIKNIILIFQCINQKIIPTKNSLYTIKNINEYQIKKLRELNIYNIKELIKFDKEFIYSMNIFDKNQLDYILQIPVFNVNIKLYDKNTEEKDKKYLSNIQFMTYIKNENKFCYKMNYYESNKIVIKIFFNFFKKVEKNINSGSSSIGNIQWYVILHDTIQDEAISIKRVNNISLKKLSNVFFILEDIEKGTYHFTIYIHNDTYYGIDDEVYLELSVE
ncbi:DEAD/DEAH box helicase, putative [Plasmodium gallinaceum]|uniref:DEAD/DEAH box helicase, putative n=1 Tax=Plasmodium gallinaceum TaxID=5849 RepID=A0A1J1GQM0_PLAGA|nr:DEAD/DEAH box helicase, putative [Plasmodium gallinaceum]CRG94586.1 DEAD/DEAH box helicase, putative [Plasmodium gallinaceum]